MSKITPSYGSDYEDFMVQNEKLVELLSQINFNIFLLMYVC